MKSYYIELSDVGKSSLKEEEITVDNLNDNEAIIKAEASLISAGTELSRAFAIKKGFKYPVRVGYSSVGRIIKTGKNLNLKENDKVFYSSYHSSVCKWSDGDKIQGPMILKLPEEIDSFDATIINLGLVSLQGINLTNIKLNDAVVVLGLGNIGIITCLLYQKMGLKVLGLDLVKERCELAKKMGVVNVSYNLDQKEALLKFNHNELANIVVDATGMSKAIISGIDLCKKYGQVLLLGSPRSSYECDISVVFNMIHMKNIKVIGAFNETCPKYEVEGSDNSLIKNFKIICEMIINKEIDVSKLITAIIDPKDCESAYFDLMYQKDKNTCVIFDWRNY